MKKTFYLFLFLYIIVVMLLNYVYDFSNVTLTFLLAIYVIALIVYSLLKRIKKE